MKKKIPFKIWAEDADGNVQEWIQDIEVEFPDP